MGLFSRRRDPESPAEPFQFTVDKVFVVPVRGVVCTGTVTSGTVRVGQAARITLDEQSRSVTVSRIEAYGKKRSSAAAGEQAGLFLGGLTMGDVPTMPGHDGSLKDGDGLAGAQVVSVF
ncbi:EF-Tu/IF-2/RF-3 family GTPase [Amycolatopsis sp. NPDC059021]|uniref:EF-Tu/IF-2/RF-3 family GTPase n=1 Tax=Amycolatopsis sp. NPDC059021 TaxID=3346704 RepID=UPI00366CB328